MAADIVLQLTKEAKITIRIADQGTANVRDLRSLSACIGIIADAVERTMTHSQVRAAEKK